MPDMTPEFIEAERPAFEACERSRNPRVDLGMGNGKYWNSVIENRFRGWLAGRSWPVTVTEGMIRRAAAQLMQRDLDDMPSIRIAECVLTAALSVTPSGDIKETDND